MSDWNRYSTEHDGRGTVYETDHQGQESASGMKDRAKAQVEQMRHGAQEASGRAREGFDNYFHRHPLLFGAGAMALGVALGMLFPATKQEDHWLGEASDKMKDRTREAAGKVSEVAKTSFREARDTARSELEERGMDAGSLKEGAREAAQEARGVAEKSAQEAKRAAEEEAQRNK